MKAQSSVLTSSGSMSTNTHLPVAVEQASMPRRRILTGASSGNARPAPYANLAQPAWSENGAGVVWGERTWRRGLWRLVR